jgi:hypothetical protein
MEQKCIRKPGKHFSALWVAIGWIAALAGWLMPAGWTVTKVGLLAAARVLP